MGLSGGIYTGTMGPTMQDRRSLHDRALQRRHPALKDHRHYHTGMHGLGSITQDQLSKALALVGYLYRNGMPMVVLPWAMTAILHETNGLKSAVSQQDNNFTGIKFVKQPGASRGRKAPDGGYYAHYPSYDYWAKDYVRILNLDRVGAGKPIAATSFPEFVARLKANGYFGASLQTYMKGMQNWARVVIDTMNKAGKTLNMNQELKQALLKALVLIAAAGPLAPVVAPAVLPYNKKGDTLLSKTAETASNTAAEIKDRWSNWKLIPTWAKWAGGIALGAFVFSAIKPK